MSHEKSFRHNEQAKKGMEKMLHYRATFNMIFFGVKGFIWEAGK